MNFLTEKKLMILMFLLFSKAIIFSQESTNSNQIDLELGFSTGPAIGEKIPEFSLPDQSVLTLICFFRFWKTAIFPRSNAIGCFEYSMTS